MFSSDAVIAALVQGGRVTDTILVTSADGTTAELVITINGVGGVVNTGTTQVAVIVDTNAGDTGELRYKIEGDPLSAGRVEMKIKRLDDDLGNVLAVLQPHVLPARSTVVAPVDAVLDIASMFCAETPPSRP